MTATTHIPVIQRFPELLALSSPFDPAVAILADEWAAAGFTPDQTQAWLEAKCWDADAARNLADAGVSPTSAAVETAEGTGGYVDTIAFKVCNSDLYVNEAVELVAAR